MDNAYSLSIEELRRTLNTTGEGLSDEEAVKRLGEVGPNEIEKKQRRTALNVLVDQFKDFLVIILIVAGVIALGIGESKSSIAIFAFVVLNTIIGFVQEYRAEKALSLLARMASPISRVKRSGRVRTIKARDLVPGDVVLIEAGDLVPADVRLSDVKSLRTQEAVLTGESAPVDKEARSLPDGFQEISQRSNVAFMGTPVVYGRGEGIVYGTGAHTELGRIATMVQTVGERTTPLQRRLKRLGVVLSVLAIVLASLLLVVGLVSPTYRQDPKMLFLTVVSLAVAAVPEALAVVVTISLAMGARRMVRRHALIRRLPAVETLGCVSFICTDKTGTLTENRMSVRNLSLASGRTYTAAAGALIDEEGGRLRPVIDRCSDLLLCTMALCNSVPEGGAQAEHEAEAEDDAERVFQQASRALQGDPTEIALVEAARSAGVDTAAFRAEWPLVEELPFDSERKMMTTVHKADEGLLALAKGAPDEVLKLCTHRVAGAHVEPLSEDEQGSVLAECSRLAEEGYRIIAFACRKVADAGSFEPSQVEQDLAYLGWAALIDPLRPEARQAVEECKSAGIRPVMITGDHPRTARKIASELGIYEEGSEVITGGELRRMSAEELSESVMHTTVFARVAPEDKLKIVEALQERRQIVAMTGDGVNDAPTLKKAEIGIAMGTGSEVAKDVADMVLLDNNFATIVGAVREGRRIYDNIRKFVRYTLSSNTAELLVMITAPLFGLPIPLIPIQILWINIATDGLPGIALAREPAEADVMQRKPRPLNENVLTPELVTRILVAGIFMGAVGLLSLRLFVGQQDVWRTIVFTVLVFSQLFYSLAVKSERTSFFTDPFSNPYLLGSVLLTMLLHLAIVYVPVLNKVFNTAPLTAGQLLYAFAASTLTFALVEVEKKWLANRVLKWVAGYGLIVLGVIMCFTPGQGILAILAGAAILGEESRVSRWILSVARRYADKAKRAFSGKRGRPDKPDSRSDDGDGTST